MLLYSHDKEFLGIDENDLKALSFLNLSELQSEVSDFADFFVKAPGYIHNFKHIHWIDYVECGQVSEEQKVIIQIKDKNYSASVMIERMFFTKEPSKKAYIVNLNNIRTLSDDENRAILENAKKQMDVKSFQPKKDPLDILPKTVFDPYDIAPDETTPEIEQIDNELELIENANSAGEIHEDLFSTPVQDAVFEQPQKPIELQLGEPLEKEEHSLKNYIYNPFLASEELGLPVELIEEFVQDFISQANSFKDSLYKSTKNGDLSELKAEIHKLVGIASNLKIEDAFSVLSKINIFQDPDMIRPYLDQFYKIIDNLSNIKISVTKHEVEQNEEKSENIDTPMVLTFKEDSSTHPKKSEDIFHEEFLEGIELYSKKTAANEIGLDIESFNILFEEYLIQSREVANLIARSTKEGNLAQCKEAAIKLKEMSDNIKFYNFNEEIEKITSANDMSNLYMVSENIISILDKLSTIKD